MKEYIILAILLIVFSLPIVIATRSKKLEDDELTKKEADLLNEIGFDMDILKVLKRGFHSGIYELSPKGKEGQQVTKGVYLTIKKDELAYEKVAVIKEELKKGGYIIFVSDFEEINGPYQICVIKTDNIYDILRFMGTNGINYNHETEDIIKKLKEWEEAYGIEIISAGFDFVEIELNDYPKDINAFAKEVYAFCPDTVEQGGGTLEALEEYIENTLKVYMWWD